MVRAIRPSLVALAFLALLVFGTTKTARAQVTVISPPQGSTSPGSDLSLPQKPGAVVMSLVLDRSGSETNSGGGAALPVAVPRFLQYFVQGIDYISLISYASSSSLDVPATRQFITPIDNAVDNLVFIGGNFGTGGGTNPAYSESYGPPLSMADNQNNSVHLPPGLLEVKAVVYYTDELVNEIQDQFACTNLGPTLYNYGGYAAPSGQDENLYAFFNAADNNSNYGSPNGNDLSWWYANNGDNGGSGQCYQPSGGGVGTCGQYPPWNATTACQGVTQFYSQQNQAMENFGWTNITAEAQYRAIITANHMRSETPVPTYVNVIGLGSAVSSSPATEQFLSTLANDPNGPANYGCGTGPYPPVTNCYNPNLPAGAFLIVPNCPSGLCTGELVKAFQLLAAKLQ